MTLKKESRNLLAEMAKKEREIRSKQFLAPYTPETKTAVVKIEGINYRFRIVGFKGSGFGVFEPIGPTIAKFLQEAESKELEAYQKILPKLPFILICDTNLGWAGCPWDQKSADSYGVNGEVIIRNVQKGKRFDVINARFDGVCFWYDKASVHYDQNKSVQLRNCFAKRKSKNTLEKMLHEITDMKGEEFQAFQLALQSWRTFEKENIHSELKEVLSWGDAELDQYTIRGEKIEVRWRTKSGLSQTSIVKKNNFDVITAGICLGGKDSQFNLQDLPAIVQLAEKMNVLPNRRNLDI